MTTLETTARRLADARLSLEIAIAAVQTMAKAPAGDIPLSIVEQARLLIRADKLADRVEDLADMLAELTADLMPSPNATA